MTFASRGQKIITTAFAISGTVHLVGPAVFESIVPHALPYKRELVYISGVAELVCAAGLIAPVTRRPAALASAALLVAVFPANIQMAADAHRAVSERGSTPAREAMRAISIARLPLQWPLIKWALQLARRS